MTSRRAIGVALSLFVTTAVALIPVEADGITARWYKTHFAFFGGAACGSTDTAQIRVGRKARRIKPAYPQVGDSLTDFFTGQPVARITAIRRVGHGRSTALQWTATGTDDVCADPDSYEFGWETDDIKLRVDYNTKEKVYFYDTREQRLYRPSTIYFGAHSGITNIHWRDWNGRKAHGRGTLPFNDCIPYCAAGNITPYPVTVTASKAKYCGGPYRYVKLSWEFRRSPARGVSRNQSTNFRYLC